MPRATPLSSVPPSRRQFLRQVAVAGSALAFPSVVRCAAPNRSIQVAAVGVDGQGYNDLHSLSSHPQVKFVGFCDVDQRRFARADQAVPGVPHFQDFRVMFEQLGASLDAVLVSTPDHQHALIAIEAMRRGKHVYCQKPLAHNVWESRQMRLWAAKTDVVTQMGNHIHSAVEYRMATRLLREGAIGRVKEVFSWVSVGGNERTRLLEPPAPGPVPAELDWDRWIGGAPLRPFAPGAYHPFTWRDWQDFGGGALGDFACHLLDPVFTGLDLRAPRSVGADNTGINHQVWPSAGVVKYVFPGTAFTAGSTLDVTWSDGGLRPDRKLAQLPANVDLPSSGSLFIGEAGNLVLPHIGGPRLYPVEKYQGFTYPKDIKGLNHYHRWVDAIAAGGKTTDGFDYAGWLSETAQLGNIAARLPKRPVNPLAGLRVPAAELDLLEWDSARLSFPRHPAANALLTRAYRPGWEVPPA